MKTPDLEDLTWKLLRVMQDAPPEERVQVFDELNEQFCRHCGSDSGIHCQCMNDE